MKHISVLFLLLGSALANPCAEHNIYLSESAITVSMSGSALCTPGMPIGGMQYNCPPGNSSGMSAWGFDIQSSCVTNWLSYAVQMPDTNPNNHYDLGLYYVQGPSAASLAGQLMLHTGMLGGNMFAPQVGLTTITWKATSNCSAPCTLPAGQYALALATDCVTKCAVLWGDNVLGYMYLFDVWLGGAAGTGVNSGLAPANCPSGNPPYCTLCITSTPGLPAAIKPPLTDPTIGQSPSSAVPRPPMVLIF